MYHILDRDDGHDDGDDKGGSKAYPSRTSYGAAFSLEEKHPHLFCTRYGVRAYNYWNGYTRAQIKLMTLDMPVVSYGKPKEKDGKTRLTSKQAADMWSEWERQRGGESLAGKGNISLENIFK